METHYIYHIPGIKIGCTSDLNKRIKDQGFTNYEILEQHVDGWLAGNRELELQKQYNLPIDTVHYMISKNNRRKFTKDDMRKGGIANSTSGHMQRLNNQLGVKKRKLTQDDADNIRIEFSKGARQIDLCKRYGVAPIAIKRIVDFITYKKG